MPIIYAQYLYWYWYLKVRYWYLYWYWDLKVRYWYLYWYLDHWYWYWYLYWYLFVEYLIQDCSLTPSPVLGPHHSIVSRPKSVNSA